MAAFLTMWLDHVVTMLLLCPRCRLLLDSDVHVALHENVEGFPHDILRDVLGSLFACSG